MDWTDDLFANNVGFDCIFPDSKQQNKDIMGVSLENNSLVELDFFSQLFL